LEVKSVAQIRYRIYAEATGFGILQNTKPIFLQKIRGVNIMKTFFHQFVIAVAMLSLTVSVSYGQLTPEDRENYATTNANFETLQINDATTDTYNGTPNPLYRIFNEYFANELTALGKSGYESGNELADDRMIRQTISMWNVNPDSQLLTSFTSSAVSHGVQVYDTSGQLRYDLGTYGSSTSGSGMDILENSQPINLNGDSYVLSATTAHWEKITTINNITNESEDYHFLMHPRVFSGDHDWYESSDEYGNNTRYNNEELEYWENKWRDYYNDEIQHLIVFDVTDLIQQRSGYENIETAFLFAFEDLALSQEHREYLDFDYQDFAFILTNVKANVDVVTPEPATALIVSIMGACALPFLKRRKKILKNDF
jgi:hypothetical protein